MSEPGFSIQGEVSVSKQEPIVDLAPLYRFCYIDASATERVLAKRQVARIAKRGFNLSDRARELDDFWAHALLAFGYHSLEATHGGLEAASNNVTVRASAPPDFRTYQLALHAAQQETAWDVGRFVVAMRTQGGDDLLTPGTPVTIRGKVPSKAGISAQGFGLRSLDSRRTCEIVTANDHGMTWSTRMFSRPLFVVGEAVNDDSGKVRLHAAAIYF